MSSISNLAAASRERKERLAQLKQIKRKQDELELESSSGDTGGSQPRKTARTDPDRPGGDTTAFLSGRNYDAEARAPRLGFAEPPVGDDTDTAERRAQQIVEAARAETEKILPKPASGTDEAAAAGADDGPKTTGVVDLFSLRPKKPNWDLRRDLEPRLAVLDVRTDNAIARLVRARIEGQQKKAIEAKSGGEAGDSGGEAVEIGMDGAALVEALHQREAEEERERKLEDADAKAVLA